MLLLLIVIALLQPVASWAQTASTIGIDAGGGVQMIDVDRGRGNAVFSLSALEPFGAAVASDARTTRLTIFNETVTFEPGSPFFRVGNNTFQLVAPVRREGQKTYVSTQFLTEFLPKQYPQKITFANGVLRPTSMPSASASPSPRARPVPAPASVPAPAPGKNPPLATNGSQATRVVIIDAGHGGIDAGKVGPNGLAEKNVTLTVANKLAALLRDKGYEIHMTRTTDTLIALADRPRFANQWKNGRAATLFVSIHANAGDARATGFETYFLSEARTEDERRVAAMENTPVAMEDRAVAKGPAIEQLLTGLRNDYYQHASNDFAEVIQRELGGFHPGPSRGVKQAGFRVLVGAVMPAVLVEIAFISNPNEARLLGTSAFQEKIAYSLSRSIANFFESHEHLWQDAPASQ